MNGILNDNPWVIIVITVGILGTCFFTWVVSVQQRKAFLLWWFLTYEKSLEGRIKNLHHNTEKVIDFSGLYQDILPKMGVKFPGSLELTRATIQRVWKEMGDARELVIDKDNYTVTVKE